MIDGKCHCQNIQFSFDYPGLNPKSEASLPVRSCTCTFCVKHGGVYTSHPEGSLYVQIKDEALTERYAFGTETAQFFICRRCGVVPFVISEIDGEIYAVVNVNTFEGINQSVFSRASADFEGEGVSDRLARRKKTWIPSVQMTFLKKPA